MRWDFAPSRLKGQSWGGPAGAAGWRLCDPGGSGVPGLRTESGIHRQFGRQCGLKHKAEAIKPRWCERPTRNPRITPVRDHQPATKSAVDLRKGSLSAGDIDNRIKELHDDMQIGQTSCSNFWANTFRVGVDGSGSCADAGDAHPPGTDSMGPGTDLDLARTFPEGTQVIRLAASHRAAPAPILSRSEQLCSSRSLSLRASTG